ncbi:MAG: 4Fe-4S binding protein [Agromyces sp.]
MLFVIADRCSKDTSCLSACPVAAIHPTPDEPGFGSAEQLYIDPSACVGCGACAVACPLETIYADHELGQSAFFELNAERFRGSTHEDPVDDEELTADPTELYAGLRVAIVGSGPSALYTASMLIEGGAEVSIFERLPTPFGLIRSGVAPDHASTKNVVRLFQPVIDSPAVNWYLNVEVGRDIDAASLLDFHHAVVWATGAAGSRSLGIPGEQLAGCHPAREFTSWYNGHPDFADRAFDLSGERAVVIGNGNVALDVARILAQPAESLENTPMPGQVVEAFRSSRVREVDVVGRRGPDAAAFTTSELLALDATEGLSLLAHRADLLRSGARDSTSVRARLIDEASDAAAAPGERAVRLRFLLTPVSIDGEDHVESITFERAHVAVVDGETIVQRTGETETIATGLVFIATGAAGQSIDGLPFDEASGRLPNTEGAVIDPRSARPLAGHYCVGWIKRGAKGVLGTNRADAAETLGSIVADFRSGQLGAPSRSRSELDETVGDPRLSIDGWLRIDEAERRAGAETGRARETLSTPEALLAAAETRDASA